MTTLALQAAPFARLLASRIERLYRRFLQALDNFAAARMRNAVPEWQLRRAQREAKRYRRLMHPDHNMPIGTTRSGR